MRKIKDMWEKSYGEGTKFDLDYGKLIIVFLCIYIAIKAVSYTHLTLPTSLAV